MGGRGCVSFRSESGSEASSEEGKPLQCFVCLFPGAQCCRKHEAQALMAFLPGAANIVWRRIAEEQGQKSLTFSSNSVNFETPSDSCFKVSSI